MKLSHLSLVLLSPFALAQRPSNTTICDYYTGSVLGSNTAANQKLLMTLLINTVVLGNYTTPNTGVAVHGIAAPGVYNGTDVNLLPYFTPELLSTNHGGDVGVGVAFLDDGGAGALLKNESSNGNTTSLQYNLLNHIYQYFGTLLNCSLQGSPDFPSYQGRTSMYEVHKFQDFSPYDMDFFIEQCTNSALSLGFSLTDVNTFYLSLQQFNSRCSPPSNVQGIPTLSNQTKELQSVCLAPGCKLDPNAACSDYAVAFEPLNVTSNATIVGSGANATSTASASGSGSPTSTSVASGGVGLGMGERVGEVVWTVGLIVLAVAYVWV
ncbi:hypothetical protein EG329_005104 [Mollisiaceae sp. DMI_Dod_QoI]|nr:hypothetical protein EG329_005104 [Helotiales sp. DMI_Dod_QoI]